jgi:murein L,D-transpeptidase YafK
MMRLIVTIILISSLWTSQAFANLAESWRSQNAGAKHSSQLTKALETKGLYLGNPVFLRITKTQSPSDKTGRLEAFVENKEGAFELFKTWDICAYSGALGPKLKQGDRQSPEGFYFVKPRQMNPHSTYHLSFNLGYPNAYDRAHGRSGNYLMVHGGCVSIGCYAMTDESIEEIYTLMSAAMKGGQPFLRVHAFPFPMTDENMNAYRGDPNIEFWKNLKTGWDWFEETGRPPNVEVVQKRYVFNVAR